LPAVAGEDGYQSLAHFCCRRCTLERSPELRPQSPLVGIVRCGRQCARLRENGGVDYARLKNSDVNVEASDFLSEHFAEALEGEFRCHIRALCRLRNTARD